MAASKFSRSNLNKDINSNLNLSTKTRDFDTRKFDQFLNDYFTRQKAEINKDRMLKLYPVSKIGKVDYVNKVYIDPKQKDSDMGPRKMSKPKFVTSDHGRTWKSSVRASHL